MRNRPKDGRRSRETSDLEVVLDPLAGKTAAQDIESEDVHAAMRQTPDVCESSALEAENRCDPIQFSDFSRRSLPIDEGHDESRVEDPLLPSQ